MEKVIDLIFKYLQTRPFWMKILDSMIVILVAFSLSASWILATNFDDIFNSFNTGVNNDCHIDIHCDLQGVIHFDAY